eukprot:6206455-Pleurochrysis_carterae.AAC.4
MAAAAASAAAHSLLPGAYAPPSAKKSASFLRNSALRAPTAVARLGMRSTASVWDSQLVPRRTKAPPTASV